MLRLLPLVLLFATTFTHADELPSIDAATRERNTAAIHEFFRIQTARLTEAALSDVQTLDDWQRRRSEIREQLFDMLGLSPRPDRTPLHATITGTVEADGFVVENLHFQSRPGLYVTANFYRPTDIPDGERLPTILYLCGHGNVKEGGVSYGSKVKYQHHPEWFARNGYCSLVVDTLQLGEIEGVHHGLYRENRWWWSARGYTPAGVEAWNTIRALDYLETRPEVDAKRIGVTGRSGGGTGTWWLAALDDRPACLVPVAGIVDYRSHVVDDCIEGHCDCNYFPNRFRIDATTYAALAAPRPLLLSNTDKDGIFPLDGLLRVHAALARIYGLYDAEDKLGLLITEGPHQDTQQLRVPAFKWMNRWLRDTDEPITSIAEPLLEKEQLRVFQPGAEPKDELNTTIDQTFVPLAETPPVPETLAAWNAQRKELIEGLRSRSFANWPSGEQPLRVRVVAEETGRGLHLVHLESTSEDNLVLPIYLVRATEHPTPAELVIDVVDDAGWATWRRGLQPAFGSVSGIGPWTGESGGEPFATVRRLLLESNRAFAIVPTRGIGPNAWTDKPREHTHILRRFLVLGRTADDGRIWDVRRAIAALREQSSLKDAEIVVRGKGPLAGVALYAGLFEPAVGRFDLHDLPASHRDGPILMNVLRVLDTPQAVALAFPRPVVLHGVHEVDWSWTQGVAKLYEDEPLRFEAP